MNVKPDGFIGMILGIEGIKDATVLLHGPDGCRKNLTVLSSKCYPRPDLTLNAAVPYYRGNSRIPCTGIVSTDYIYGSYNKVKDALGFIDARGTEMVAVICSPGASLIGDDCGRAIEENGMEDRAIVMDAKLISEPLNVGIDQAALEAVKKLVPGKREKVKGRINLLGLNILMKDWTTIVEEFTSMFGIMGLEVVCPLCAGSSVADIRASAESEVNVIMCPEYCQETARYYDEVLGIPSVGIDYSPVGFDATIELLRKVAEATGTDATGAVNYVLSVRRRAYNCLMSAGANKKGDDFAVDADPCIAYPLVRLMYDYMSMVPVSIKYNGKHYAPAEKLMEDFLSERNMSDALTRDLPEYVDTLFCEGNTAQLERASHNVRHGVDVSFPSIMNVDFRPSPVLGPAGALYLLESIVNKY